MRLLVLLLALLALLAFFAAGELALIRLRPSRVRCSPPRVTAAPCAVERLQQRLRRVLVATQLGAALALVALGWAGRGLAVRLDPGAERLWIDVPGVSGAGGAGHRAGRSGCPRPGCCTGPESSALRLAPLLESVIRTLAPLLMLVERFTDGLLRLLGLPRNWDELVPALSAGELETLIESNSVTGLLPDERSILEGVFSLRDTQVREVMVPRSGMVTLPLEVTFAEMMEAVHATAHARFPVIGQSLDDVRGMLDLRRLAEPIAQGPAAGRHAPGPLHHTGGPGAGNRLPGGAAAADPQRPAPAGGGR